MTVNKMLVVMLVACLGAPFAVGGLLIGALEAAAGDGAPGLSPVAVPGVPVAYMRDAVTAGARFDVPWSVLLGIYRVECDFGRALLPGCNPVGSENPVGAQGPGQFLPGTWRAGLAPHAVILPGPPTTSDAAGFATDGDGDGIADVWDPADAVASTARLLAADGAASDLGRAIWSYNHSWAYVQQVLALAKGYEEAATLAVASGPVAAVLAFARSQLGVPYVWGGASPSGWDCSGLVMAAFAEVGLHLPHNAQLQYEATMGDAVPLSALQPGDLVFFGPSLASIGHVGIVVGAGQMIDAPHTGAVVRMEPYTWPDLLVATRPLAALGPGS